MARVALTVRCVADHPAGVSGAATANSPQALESLDRIAALPADSVLTEHGEPWLSTPADAVAIARLNGSS